MAAAEQTVSLKISDYSVTVKLNNPGTFRKALVIANGAGANMDSSFQLNYARDIANRGILTVRFNFYFQELGKKIPDRNEKCQQTYQGVLDFLTKNYLQQKDIVIGGKSMGGRIATQIADRTECRKIVVFGYPLHPPGKPDKLRDAHLYPLQQKLFIIQGENDALGTKIELEPVLAKLRDARAYFVLGANHSLKIPKKMDVDRNQIENNILNEVMDFVSD